MNRYVSRPRLVAVAMCLTLLVVAGVGYSQATAASCESYEKLLRVIEQLVNTCEEDCEALWTLQGALTCHIEACWDAVDGVCPLAGA